jgi:hypothetical protein
MKFVPKPTLRPRGLHAWGKHLLRAAFVGFSLAACASGFDGHHYQNGAIDFRLGHVPSEWRQIEIDDTAVAFRDDGAQSTTAINARCGKDAEDVPLVALRRHLFLHFTERDVLTEETFELDGREALKSEIAADLDGVRKHFLVVVLKKDGCVYDFLGIYAEPPDDAARQTFSAVVSGFSTKGK